MLWLRRGRFLWKNREDDDIIYMVLFYLWRWQMAKKRMKEKTQGEVIDESLNRMQKYLERKGVASNKVDLERNTIIEIVGTGDDGRERLIVPEIKNKYGSDNVELDDSFQVLIPFIRKGTVKIDVGGIRHYEEYEVYDVTDTKFSLKIKDYIKSGKAFALMLIINVKSITKVAPISSYSYESKTVMDFFINPYKDMIKTNFTDYEKQAIIEPLMADSHESNIVLAICNIIAIFRAMNFLKKRFDECNKPYQIYSNEYFRISNWNGKMDVISAIDVLDNQKEELLSELISNMNYSTVIPNNQTAFVLKELIRRENINVFFAAVGFVYESGIKILEKELKQIADRPNSDIELIIGSLQHFDTQNPGTKIDRSTVVKLNELIEKMGVKVYAYQPSFYHGKFYYLQSANKGYVIVGSSNISKTAFNDNYELDVIHTFEPKMINNFANWFFQLRSKSKEIIRLDEERFHSTNWISEQDAFLQVGRSLLSLENVRNEISQLTDEDKKYRMNLWLEHNPTCIYKDVNVNALKNYIMIVYAINHLAVFESFIPGNAYYVFCYDDMDVLLEEISHMTKSQMMLAEYSTQRGNHIPNRDKLKIKIDKLFE